MPLNQTKHPHVDKNNLTEYSLNQQRLRDQLGFSGAMSTWAGSGIPWVRKRKTK